MDKIVVTDLIEKIQGDFQTTIENLDMNRVPPQDAAEKHLRGMLDELKKEGEIESYVLNREGEKLSCSVCYRPKYIFIEGKLDTEDLNLLNPDKE